MLLSIGFERGTIKDTTEAMRITTVNSCVGGRCSELCNMSWKNKKQKIVFWNANIAQPICCTEISKGSKTEVALKTLNHTTGNGARLIYFTESWSINCCNKGTLSQFKCMSAIKKEMLGFLTCKSRKRLSFTSWVSLQTITYCYYCMSTYCR